MRRPLLVGMMLLPWVAPRALPGQTLSPEQRRALVERAALADAYRQLRGKVLALPLGGARTVNDLAASSALIAIGLRRLVGKAERLGPTRRYTNGDAEVDLRLPLGPFIEGLHKLHAAVEPTGPIKAGDLDALARRSGARDLVVTGYGQPPTEDELTGPPGWPGAHKVGDLPPAGWANVTAAGYKAAQRAANLDAVDHLVRQIAQLKMERGHTAADLIAAAPAVGRGLRQPFKGLRVANPEFLPEQVCRLYAETDVPAVVARLAELRAALDPKPNVTESDIRSIARLARTRRLRAVGYGLPPASTLRRNRYAAVDLDEPAWAKQSIRANSRSSLPRTGPPTDRAVEIAILDARLATQLKLAQQIDLLELPGGQAVGAFLDRHEELADDILTFLSAARPVKPPTVDKPGRQVTLEMALPLRRLWLILRDAIPTVEAPKPATKE